MAARQNQSYMIWIITLVVLVLGLSVGLFLAYFKALEYSDANSQAEAQLAQQKSLAEVREIQSQILFAMIGSGGESTAEIDTNVNRMDQILNSLKSDGREQVAKVIEETKKSITEYEKNMALITAKGDNTPQASYLGVYESISAALKEKIDEYNTLRDDLTRTETEAAAKVSAMQAERDDANNQKDLALKSLEDEKQARIDDRKTLEEERNRIIALNADGMKQVQAGLVGFERELSVVKNENSQLEESNRDLYAQNQILTTENFDRPDGEIVSVADGLGIVYINLGSASGLRNNYSFAVYSQGITNFEKGKSKAAIEVIRIIGPRLAEAKIKNEDLRNPILKGDPIISPTFDVGDRVKVGLAGVFDLDYDGKDDRDQLIRKLEANNANVVVYHDDEGNIIGEVDPTIKLFVIGDPQRVDADVTDFNPALAKAARTLEAEAKKKYLRIVDMRTLFEMFGLQNVSPVVPLDGNIGRPYELREREKRMREEAASQSSDQ